MTVPSASAWFERGAPVMADGRYDLWAVACWHAENCGRRGGGAEGQEVSSSVAGGDESDGDGGSRANWDLRRVRAAALTAELKLKEARRVVISRAEHDEFVYGIVDSFVIALENMPPRITPLLVAARGYQEIDRILRDHVRAMRIQLAAKHSPPIETADARAEGTSDAKCQR